MRKQLQPKKRKEEMERFGGPEWGGSYAFVVNPKTFQFIE